VEFFQANLREKLTTRLPLHFVGDSPAVRDGGILLTVMDHVEIECLPDDVPAGGIEVDVSKIEEINGTIHVRDLDIPDKVTLLTAPDEVVAKVDAPISEEEIEEVLEEVEPVADIEGEEAKAAAESPKAVPEA
jgi:large subunit ribosomal protein L25